MYILRKMQIKIPVLPLSRSVSLWNELGPTEQGNRVKSLLGCAYHAIERFRFSIENWIPKVCILRRGISEQGVYVIFGEIARLCPRDESDFCQSTTVGK